jgi:predicted nucleic acid-binding protein
MKFWHGATKVILARAHGISVYDDTYLELAVRRASDLASIDRSLRRAAIAEGLMLVE